MYISNDKQKSKFNAIKKTSKPPVFTAYFHAVMLFQKTHNKNLTQQKKAPHDGGHTRLFLRVKQQEQGGRGSELHF